MLGVNTQRPSKKNDKGSQRGNAKKGLKVVYISSPVKVTTSAAEFRATVQELTGRDSDVTRFADCSDGFRPSYECVGGRRQKVSGEYKVQNTSNQSAGSSEGAAYDPNYLASWESQSPSTEYSETPFDDMSVRHRDADFCTSRMFQDSALLEAIGSFDLS
ncbi:hypothetical protein MLD38_002742 [Melastoma candidum]|uniref:Uncharacterized protein n=1 Tax=Melastoma candidum TaxID=119954 RepID=A0ACB9S1N8_9MYRT|nr:hypothetical protein MLD38_002742 [Melastoma candidum]